MTRPQVHFQHFADERIDAAACRLRRAASSLVAALMLGSLVVGCSRAPQDPRPVVAISRFDLPMAIVLPGWSSVQTDLLHNQLLAAVVRSGRVVVVERTRLDTVLKEQSLTRREITDASAAAAVGKLLGARYFVIGTISDLKTEEKVEALPYTNRSEHIVRGRIKVDARIIDVESGTIVAGETEDCGEETRHLERDREGTARLREQLIDQCAARLSQRITDALAPIRVVRVGVEDIELDAGTSAGVHEGQTLDVHERPASRVGAATGAPVARIQVVAAKATSATARAADGGVVEPGAICRPAAMPALPPTDAPTDPLADRW